MIDLRSDTVTKPSPAMREAMAHAEVGDDVFGEDPTVNRLQDVAARLVGKEAALFVPSGTMANQLAVHLHTNPGDEMIVEGGSHVVRYESGAAAALSGVQTCWLSGARGILEPEQIEAAIRPPDYHNPPTTLISLENTHNRGGGAIYPLATIGAIRKIAEARRIAMHLDGARLFNAVVATGIAAADYARSFETVSFCLSKGLGAPVGSVICSDGGRIGKLRRLRKMFGGGMRQAGIVAAAGLYALEHNIESAHDRPSPCETPRRRARRPARRTNQAGAYRDQHCGVRYQRDRTDG
jgi:threonine aldolase